MSDKQELPKRGQRVRVTKDCTHWGYSYTAGQLGTMMGVSTLLIELDGYEDERKASEEQFTRTGEPFNVVPFNMIFESDEIEAI